MVRQYSYDLVCVGSGPAGQRAAVQAAKLGKRVAVVEKRVRLGGCSLETGTLPSKTFRDAVLSFAGMCSRSGFHGTERLASRPTVQQLLGRVDQVLQREAEVVEDQLRRNGIEVYRGHASFSDPHTLMVEGAEDGTQITAANILIAVGTVPAAPPDVDADDETIITSDGVLRLNRLPRTMAVIGAGVIGIEYASMFATLGVDVTLVDRQDRPLKFIDREIVDELIHQMRSNDVLFRLGERVARLEKQESPEPRVVVFLESGKRVVSELVPYETGVARYREIARGQILGDDSGLFKMLFHRETRRLLGVHIIGTAATELLHIGQAVMGLGGGPDCFLRTVFNYPTLAECYKVAALDASNKLRT